MPLTPRRFTMDIQFKDIRMKKLDRPRGRSGKREAGSEIRGRMLSYAVVDRPPPVLDYSSPAEEQQRDRAAEDERREKVLTYNESTFGEGRPIAAAFGRLAVFMTVAALGIWLLPRDRHEDRE